VLFLSRDDVYLYFQELPGGVSDPRRCWGAEMLRELRAIRKHMEAAEGIERIESGKEQPR